MLNIVRAFLIAAVVLAGCAPPPPPKETVKVDPTTESWYASGVDEVVALNREAESLFRQGKSDAAASSITKAQALLAKLLAAPRPTLAAMQAAGDLDDLYGRMLLANGNIGWARLQFQKNVGRWKNWRPQTEETVRRRKQAEARIAECDRKL